MKKLLTIPLFISTVCFSQPPGKIESVLLENNNLFQINTNGAKIFKGAVIMSPFLDVNGNLLVGKNPTLINAFNNIIGGNNVTISNASSIAALCTDCDFVQGSNYSIGGGDAHDIGGYSSATFGYLNKNYIDGGIAFGTNITMGSITANNRYTQSVGIGAVIRIDNSHVFAFGKGDGSILIQPGVHLVQGQYKISLLPDGRIVINGVPYRFPQVQGQGVLTNDGFGNLSWQTTTTLQPTAFKVYNSQGQLLFYQSIKQ